jgi:hypothetical protein
MLTEEQKIALNNEIANDPEGLGYAAMLAAGMPGHVVDTLNARTGTRVGIISRSDLTTWAAATGMRAVIEDKAMDAQSPLRASALAILDVLKGSSDGIDLSKQSNMNILIGWETDGALSTADKKSMLDLATHPASRMEILGLPYATEEMLREL